MCVEFRHQSWFDERFKEQTLSFLMEHQIIHSVVDEPQVKEVFHWSIVLLMKLPLFVITVEIGTVGRRRI